MEVNAKFVEWQSAKNYLFLNPKLPKVAFDFLQSLAEKVIQQKKLSSYIVLTSSGSTVSDPSLLKLVFIRQSSFLENAKNVSQFLGLSARDNWLQVLPQFHVGGLSILSRQFVSNCKITQVNEWSPDVFQNIKKITYASLVPTQVYDLVQAQIRAPVAFKNLIVGGGFLNPNLKLSAEKLGWKILLSYGMTETSSMISLSEDYFLRPLGLVELKLSDKGRLGIKSETLAEFTVFQTATGAIDIEDCKDKSSFFWTEDRAELVDGKYKILGRDSDFVKIGGEGTNLESLRKIWEAIAGIEFSRRSALLARPSERLGHEIILAFEGAPSEINSMRDIFNGQVLANQKIRDIVSIKKIPRTALGKVLWKSLENEINQQEIK